ncbi:MAG: DUF177 domain-containing protein [Anaerovoracaceae bacterium]
MEIIVSEIPPEGLVIDCSRDETWFQRQATEETLGRFAVEGIGFHCAIERAGRQVSISGNMEIRCRASCARCLEPFSMVIRNGFFYAMSPAMGRLGFEREQELREDELEIGLYDNDRIDMEPIFTEQVFLQIPIRTVCHEGCRGLCPVCGANLNRTDCGHESTAKIDSPFAVLKHYEVSRKRS